MLKKNKSLLLTVAAAAFLIGGGIATYLTLISQESIQIEDMPVGANLVPQDTMMAIDISTDPQQWKQLRQFGTRESQAAFERNLAELRDRLLTTYGYNYQRDIQPWVGDRVTIAFLRQQNLNPTTPATSDSIPSPPAKQSMAIVLPIADPVAAKAVLEKPQPTQGELTQRQYKDIKILQTTGSPSLNYSIAVLGGKFLIVTTSGEAMNRTIDTYKGGDPLARSPGYAGAVREIETGETPTFAQIYINVPRSAAYASVNSTRTISQDKLKQLEDNQGIATNAILTSDGIQFQAISWLKPDSEKKFAVENNATGMLQRIPANALMMMSGSNLQRAWEDYAAGSQANPIAPISPEVVRKTFKDALGMDLESDLLSWMDGEFSLSLIPIPVERDAVPTKFAAGFVLMVKTSDRRLAEETFEKLDKALISKEFQVGEAVAQGKPVVKWTSPFGGYSLLRGWLSGNVAFLTLGAPEVAHLILPAPTDPIAESKLAAQSLGLNLDEDNNIDLSDLNGSFLIDVARAFNSENLSLPQLPPSQQIWLNTIDSIGVTSVVSSDRRTRYNIVVKLKSPSP